MTRKRISWLLTLALIAAFGGCLAAFLARGVSTRGKPMALEAFVATRLRHLAIPRSLRAARNPVPETPEVLADARGHFADHCASCHANDGSGSTEIGQNLYPKAPDMRAAGTQSLTDGELFAIIQNGVRFTGMPAWGSGTPADDQDSWKLVRFIRHLPKLTPEEVAEMQTLNPVSPREQKEQQDEEQFLNGGDNGNADDTGNAGDTGDQGSPSPDHDPHPHHVSTRRPS